MSLDETHFWMKLSLDETGFGRTCHWTKPFLDETVFGMKVSWMKLSSVLDDESGFG